MRTVRKILPLTAVLVLGVLLRPTTVRADATFAGAYTLTNTSGTIFSLMPGVTVSEGTPGVDLTDYPLASLLDGSAGIGATCSASLSCTFVLKLHSDDGGGEVDGFEFVHATVTLTDPPEGVTDPPEGITDPPEGITGPPTGITGPPTVTTQTPEPSSLLLLGTGLLGLGPIFWRRINPLIS